MCSEGPGCAQALGTPWPEVGPMAEGTKERALAWKVQQIFPTSWSPARKHGPGEGSGQTAQMGNSLRGLRPGEGCRVEVGRGRQRQA